jgi:hypothetical protein
METISAELVDTGAKRDGRGRRLAVRRECEAMITAYERSGMTQREFSQREGIKFHTFTGWLKRYRPEKPKPAFARVKIATRAPELMEVALPSGVVVRGSDVDHLAMLVQRLNRC